MHRHKIAAALVVIGAPALAALSGPAAAETVYHGPKCADIVDGSAAYEGTAVLARMSLGAKACRAVNYTLTITDATGSTVLATASGSPTTDQAGGPATAFQTAVADPTPADGVCVYVTTSLGKRVFDRAPDEGCVAIDPGSASGQRFH